MAIDFFSLIATKLSLYCNGHFLGVASGFVWKTDERHFLVSNWHVFSGRDCYCGQPLSKLGAIPNHISAQIALVRPNSQATWGDIPLNTLNDTEVVGWLQHPKMAQDIDVAAVLLPPPPLGWNYASINVEHTDRNMFLGVGDEVFVIGYPKGIAKQGPLPIWKRASVASEPDISFDGLPLFVVDTATREGMSGSPVFRRSAVYQSRSREMTFSEMPNTQFVRIYSGRYGANDEISAQLGRVWLSSLVEEVVLGGSPGSYEIRPPNPDQLTI